MSWINPVRLCLIGPTGSGKSTIARYIAAAYDAEIIKIAQPLYEFQTEFYQKIGKRPQGQDGELLQFLGEKIEKENPGWLARIFIEKVNASHSRLIVNDDCRPNSYEALVAANFKFIRVHTHEKQRSVRARGDHIPINPAHPVELGIDNLKCNFEIDNSGDLDATTRQIDQLLVEFVGGESGWLTGSQIEKEFERGRISIEPFDRDCLNSNSYNYHLARTIHRLTSEIIDCRKEDEVEIIEIPDAGYLLKPFELYLGSTVERFGSNFFASLVTGRSSIGRKFITNHITAGLIDQGFAGNITLEIVVQRPTVVYPNMKFGQIFWFTTFGWPRLYGGKYVNQRGPVRSKLHEEE